MLDELTYWFTVGLVAVLAVAAFKLLAVKSNVPALGDLAAFI